jgi:hypothetical protein
MVLRDAFENLLQCANLDWIVVGDDFVMLAIQICR